MRTFLIALGSFVVLALPAFAAEPVSLLSNGDFQTAKDDGPRDWKTGGGITWEQDGENRFLRLAVVEPEKQVLAYRAINVPKDAQALRLAYKVRYEGIVRGKANYFDGRIMMDFKDAAGSKLKPAPKHPNYVGTKAEWTVREQTFRVPEGATQLELMFTLFNAKAGRLDFDDITVTPYPVAELDAAEKAAADKEAARIAALPKPKPQVEAPAADKLPKPLHVDGNQVKDADGKTVWLQGVAIPSLEWSGGGEHILESIDVAIKEWKCNCVRLPIREHFWIGKGPYQNDGGMKYRQLVDDAVNSCAGRSVYIVLDLHAYRAPEQKHADFWKDVATKYKNHPAVLFDLLNEPHDVSWKIWRDGGRVTDKPKDGAVLNENQAKLAGFDSIGMQKLLDVVRETGAKNIAIVGGLDWAYDLSGILDGYCARRQNRERHHVFLPRLPVEKRLGKQVHQSGRQAPAVLGRSRRRDRTDVVRPARAARRPVHVVARHAGPDPKAQAALDGLEFSSQIDAARDPGLELYADPVLGRVRQEGALRRKIRGEEVAVALVGMLNQGHVYVARA
ncbi:MAG: cellulase family glycosylhydrolase [Pirellulales bacterium]